MALQSVARRTFLRGQDRAFVSNHLARGMSSSVIQALPADLVTTYALVLGIDDEGDLREVKIRGNDALGKAKRFCADFGSGNKQMPSWRRWSILVFDEKGGGHTVEQWKRNLEEA